MSDAGTLEAAATTPPLAPADAVDGQLELTGHPVAPPPPPPPPPVEQRYPRPPEWAFTTSDPATAAAIASAPPDDGLARPYPSLGPVGKRRRPITVMVLSALTLGAYGLYWHDSVNEEMSDFDARITVHPGRSSLALALPWLIGLAATIAAASELGLRRVPPGFELGIRGWVLIGLACGVLAVPLMMALFAPSLTAVVMTVERLRITEERVGVTTDHQVRPARRAALLLLPVVGGPLLMALTQHRLNAVWEATDPNSRRNESDL